MFLTGEPYFDIIGFRSRKSHISGAECDHPIGEVQPFQDLFRIAHKPFKLLISAAPVS